MLHADPRSGTVRAEDTLSSRQELRILVLGLVGLVFCQLLAPVAFIQGNRYARWCDAMGRDPGTACTVGRVFGFFGSLLLIVQAILLTIVAIGALGAFIAEGGLTLPERPTGSGSVVAP